MRKRNLLVLVTLAWVAPLSASAEQHPAPISHDPSECPFARARAAAAAREARSARAIAVREGASAEGSLFDVRRHSAALSP